MLGQSDAAALARFLDEPRQEFGTRVTIAERDNEGRLAGTHDAHVWHCSLSLHPDEPAPSDQQWGEICDEFVTSMGFAGADARAQCRWVGVRHGESAGGSDHVHVVVSLVAEDGSKASVHYDQPRSQNAARSLEQRFGLRRLEARARETGSRGVRAGERMADAHRDRDHGTHGQAPERGSRQTLERIVRACAAASQNESEFVRALREHKVRVRPRYAQGARSSVVGYSVALPGPASGSQRAIWFGGGRLARDLTLPSLREGWQQSAGEQENAVKEWSRWTSSAPRTRDERRAELEHRAVRWHQCVSDVDRLRRQLRRVTGDPAGTARVARDAAGILAAWSVALEADEPGSLARASRHLGTICGAARLSPRASIAPPSTQFDARAIPSRGRAAGYHRSMVCPRPAAISTRARPRPAASTARRGRPRARARDRVHQPAPRPPRAPGVTVHTATGRSAGNRRDRARAQTTASPPTRRSRRSTGGCGCSPRNRRHAGSATTPRKVALNHRGSRAAHRRALERPPASNAAVLSGWRYWPGR